MCGIVGTTALAEPRAVRCLIGEMALEIAHRGPDGSGLWTTSTGSSNATLGLGHRRLAIIDLSEDANQPMHRGLGRGPDGEDLTVVFNGEIYNFVELKDELASVGYVFHNNSDTELLLAAYAHWGTDCLNRFRGMFAFALWDAPRGELLLARDPFGKKPLLYFLHDNQIAFASELSALLRARFKSS